MDKDGPARRKILSVKKEDQKTVFQCFEIRGVAIGWNWLPKCIPRLKIKFQKFSGMKAIGENQAK